MAFRPGRGSYAQCTPAAPPTSSQWREPPDCASTRTAPRRRSCPFGDRKRRALEKREGGAPRPSHFRAGRPPVERHCHPPPVRAVDAARVVVSLSQSSARLSPAAKLDLIARSSRSRTPRRPEGIDRDGRVRRREAHGDAKRVRGAQRRVDGDRVLDVGDGRRDRVLGPEVADRKESERCRQNVRSHVRWTEIGVGRDYSDESLAERRWRRNYRHEP